MPRNTARISPARCVVCWVLAQMAGTVLWAAETKPANIALGRPCRAFSSHEQDGWSLAHLTDGKTGALGWSSKAFTAYADHALFPEFVVVDLGVDCAVRRVDLYPRGDGDRRGMGLPRDFTIQVCREGEPWQVVMEKKDYSGPPGGGVPSFALTQAEGRYVKIEATRLGEVDGTYRFQLAELAVMGWAVAGTALESLPVARGGGTTVGHLRCENREEPAGIDALQPRLSWWMRSAERGQGQTAYRVMVSSSEMLLKQDQGDVWDSGKVEGGRSVAVRYGGRPLESGQGYWWKVRLWDRDGKACGWSEPARFMTGKLRPEDWRGDWIGADAVVPPGPDELRNNMGAPVHTTTGSGSRPVYLRKELVFSKPVRRATVFYSGLGFSELYVDGKKTGEHVIGPGFTTYNKRVQYLACDVTERFREPGRVALGVLLVDGWYGNGYGHGFEKHAYVDRPKLLLNLHLEHLDGTETVVVSDGSWKWSTGEITLSSIVQEDVDRRRARPGWDRPGFDDGGWRPVSVVKGPEGRLVRQKEPPCRVVEEVRPVRMTYDGKSQVATYDFGREIAGWVRFRTSGPAGTAITITTQPSCDLTRTSMFTLAGSGGDEVYEPRFFYTGMRRVVVKGLARPPAIGDLTGCVVSADWRPSGSFRCSDGVANWLNEATRRTVVNYTTWLPNDPVREWKAWTQDIQTMFWSSAYLFDVQTMYERWQGDMLDTQRGDGNCANVTPGGYYDDYNSPWWGGCVVWLPWEWYLYYGDDALLRESYPAMKRYVDFLGKVSKDGLQDWGLADWCPVEETPRPLINTPAHFLYAQIVGRTARLLGLNEEAGHYDGVAEKVRQAFNARYLDAGSGVYGQPGTAPRNGYPIPPVGGRVPHGEGVKGDRPCTQAGQVLPLALGMVPAASRPAVERALLREIADHRDRLSTGFVSTPYLLQVLRDLAPETGWTLTSAQDYPSWYGMTAGSDQDLLKETWAGGQALMPSLGGNIAAWQYQTLGGIFPDPSGPGFKKTIIKPNVVGDLHWVECSHDSVHGRIISQWRKRGRQLVLDVTIPANTKATVHVPARDAGSVTENGNAINKAEGVTFLGMERGAAVYAIGSGSYRFRAVLPGGAPEERGQP